MYIVELTKRKKWFFRVRSTRNGQTIMVSQDYVTKWNAKRAALNLVKANGFRYEES